MLSSLRASPLKPTQVLGSGNYGRAFVQFLELEGAIKAREAIQGRMFSGQTVAVGFMQPEKFMALYQ